VCREEVPINFILNSGVIALWMGKQLAAVHTYLAAITT
jgi:hypothetical protein